MSANRHRPHVLVLPEDDANRELVNGFLLALPTRQIQPLPVAGGWREVLRRFESEHIDGMNKYSERLMVLLLDFDGIEERFGEGKAVIPAHLTDRVFILGVWTEPEDLRKANLGSLENIGQFLASDCRGNRDRIWGHELLRHNASELTRLCERIGTILS